MIYPSDFESRLGFDRIRQLTEALLQTKGAVELLSECEFSSDPSRVRELVGQTAEMLRILQSEGDFISSGFKDINSFLPRIRIEGTFLESAQMVDLLAALELLGSISRFFISRAEASADGQNPYPLLSSLGDTLGNYSPIIAEINRIIDRFGRVKDSASPELGQLRRSISERSSQISKRLLQILKQAQVDGYAEAESQPSMRDGRAVLPIIAGSKRKIRGLVHSESATGRTSFIEPIEVVELNNEVRELENRERREVVRILMAFADMLRPRVDELMEAGNYLLNMELIVAKARLARGMEGVMPQIVDTQELEFHAARHPVLEKALKAEGKPLVPLDIRLTPEKHILVISGPNAGGKSVCLKTVGLLQYMLQCGFLVPMAEDSRMGIFESIFVDIGDQQSIDNDLSTYSSHLINMKTMLAKADTRSMILIDEFGSGTEPTTGGAIAESILEKLDNRGVFGVITTHYANLKYYASISRGIENGAMTFDVQSIRPLFKLEMGHAGSSFAFEIARKIGLPEEIITTAATKIGSDQVDLEKQLRQVARDKRYWEGKRERIRSAEKGLDRTAAQYEMELSEIQAQRDKIIKEAKIQAQTILSDANSKIENTIRQIKESAAERNRTQQARGELNTFRALLEDQTGVHVETDPMTLKIQQLREKERRRKERKANAAAKQADLDGADQPQKPQKPKASDLEVGYKVRIKGQSTIGEVLSISGDKVVVAFGALMTSVDKSRLDVVPHSEFRKQAKASYTAPIVGSYDTRAERLNFTQRLDVRGMRAVEALQSVELFVDQAIMLGFDEVTILHGKGTGALKQQIREYLQSQPIVLSVRDEKEEFGGAGITVVKFDI